MYADESKETSRVFTAAEKAQLWDRWGEANLDRLIQNGKGKDWSGQADCEGGHNTSVFDDSRPLQIEH